MAFVYDMYEGAEHWVSLHKRGRPKKGYGEESEDRSMRLFDRLSDKSSSGFNNFRASDPAVFIADNVFADADTELLSYRLPYPNMFVEVRRPFLHWGWRFSEAKWYKGEDLAHAYMFCERDPKGPWRRLYSVKLDIDPVSYRPVNIDYLPYRGGYKSEDEYKAGVTQLRELIAPIFATINLLNCNNVQILDQAPPPKLSKKHEQKHGRPLVTFKTLHITPMAKPHFKQELLEVLPQTDNSKPLPLHEIRGHIKDYRDGKGLFGKHKGVYWWTPHVKGDPLNGVVVKDYEIDQPE